MRPQKYPQQNNYVKIIMLSTHTLVCVCSWRAGRNDVEDEGKGDKKGYHTLDRRGGKGGFTTDWGPRGFLKSNHPLSIMVREMPVLFHHT